MSRPILIVRESALSCPLVALVVACPVAAAQAGPFLVTWLELAALSCVPFALFIAAARMARRSLVELFPASRRPLFIGVAVWALLSFPADALLGFALKATTHHRGLGGATFGALAFAANVAAALVARSVAADLAQRDGVVRGVLNICLAVGLVAMTLIASRAALGVPGGAAALDGVVAVAATLLAARWDAPRRGSGEGRAAGMRSPAP